MNATFSIPKELLEAIRLQAEKERRTISAILVFALEKYLKEAQDGE